MDGKKGFSVQTRRCFGGVAVAGDDTTDDVILAVASGNVPIEGDDDDDDPSGRDSCLALRFSVRMMRKARFVANNIRLLNDLTIV